jgi:hypothetical protein
MCIRDSHWRNPIPKSPILGCGIKGKECPGNIPAFENLLRKDSRRKGCNPPLSGTTGSHPRMEASREIKGLAVRTCSDLLPREMVPIPFEKVPGPPGALEKGDGLKAQLTSWSPVSGGSPGSSRSHVSAKGLGWQGKVKLPLLLFFHDTTYVFNMSWKSPCYTFSLVWRVFL